MGLAKGNLTRVIATIFAGVAQILTAFRLSYRIKIRRFWIDDAWAGLSMVFSFVLIVALWIRTDVVGIGPFNQPKSARIVAYWLLTILFTCCLWAARMSMLFSIIRIIPPMMTLRRITYYLAGLFGAMWIALLTQKVVHCASDKSWYALAAPQCHLGEHIAITELCFDFISDAILVVIPLRLLWRITMAPDQRKLLIVIFSASILTTVVSVVHAVYLLGPTGLFEAITANVEAATSLIVANLAVVVTYIYRLIRNGGDLEGTPVYLSKNTSGSNTLSMKRIPNSSSFNQKTSALRFANATSTDTMDDTKSYPVMLHSGVYDGSTDHKRPFDDLADYNNNAGSRNHHTMPGVQVTRMTTTPPSGWEP